MLARYEELGYRISMFDPNLRVRGATPEGVLAACREPQRPMDFSIILSSAAGEATRMRDLTARPMRAAGLEVSETEDGLSVHQAGRKQVHRLNHSAAIVFDLCTGEHSAARIIELVQEVYELADSPAAEVLRCLDRLRSEGLIR